MNFFDYIFALYLKKVNVSKLESDLTSLDINETTGFIRTVLEQFHKLTQKHIINGSWSQRKTQFVELAKKYFPEFDSRAILLVLSQLYLFTALTDRNAELFLIGAATPPDYVVAVNGSQEMVEQASTNRWLRVGETIDEVSETLGNLADRAAGAIGSTWGTFKIVGTLLIIALIYFKVIKKH